MSSSAHEKSQTIRTPDQRLRVFVSSTLQELASERSAAREAISQLHLAPVMFELGARPHPARNLYRAYLEQSHIFVGIYWQSYGWVAPNESISGLEDEYRLSGDKPKLIYIKSPAPEREPRLAELLARIKSEDAVSYKYFSNANELRELLEDDLAVLLTERFEQAQVTEPASVQRRTNLPRPVTRLIGRNQELSAACNFLRQEECRLLTLTGPGGTGKTRLALQVAADLLDHFEDGVFFVDLVSLGDPGLLISKIAATLDIRETVGGRPLIENLKDYLHKRHTLLLLDNFEQVVSAAPIIADLLESCPCSKVLVTSRVLLRLRGEHDLPVPPLPLPERGRPVSIESLQQVPAIALFIQRAQSVNPAFSMTRENAAMVVDICRGLDGLPLAIELAAARIRVLSPQALLARLERRLDILKSGPRDLPTRQQTLRNAIDWSYELLDAEAQRLFRRLAVFVGGWSLEGAQAISKPGDPDDTDILDVLEKLLDHSLLKQSLTANGELRFGMLETIREYSSEKLAQSGEESDIRRRHAEYYLNLAIASDDGLRSVRRVLWTARLEDEHDNLRAVIRRSLSETDETQIGARLAAALPWFWQARGHLTEGRTWLMKLLARMDPSERSVIRARVLLASGGIAWSLGDYIDATPLLKESVAINREVGDRRNLAYALSFLGLVSISRGSYDECAPLYEESAALFRELGDKWGEAFTLNWMGILVHDIGDMIRSSECYKQSLALWRETGDPWGTSIPLISLGAIALAQKNYTQAETHLEESASIARTFGDRWTLSWVLGGLGYVALQGGDTTRARALFKESLALGYEVGNQTEIIVCLAGVARLAAEQGQSALAASLIGAAAALRESLNVQLWHAWRVIHDESFAYTKSHLDEQSWAIEFAKGNAMTLEQAIALAMNDMD